MEARCKTAKSVIFAVRGRMGSFWWSDFATLNVNLVPNDSSKVLNVRNSKSESFPCQEELITSFSGGEPQFWLSVDG